MFCTTGRQETSVYCAPVWMTVRTVCSTHFFRPPGDEHDELWNITLCMSIHRVKCPYTHNAKHYLNKHQLWNITLSISIHTQCQTVLERGIARSKRDGTRAETRFGLSAKRTSPFKSVGVSVQSTTGSRGVRIGGQRLYRPCSDVQCKAAGYPLHSHLSPSLPHPCVTVCHQVPNAL